MLLQVVVLVTTILCMQTALGQIQPPAGCLCYSTGGVSPRRPCTGLGCSLAAKQDCYSDISLFLFYPDIKNANPASPSTTANRFGACSCPVEGSTFRRYRGKTGPPNGSGPSPNNNAYYDVGPGSNNMYFNATTCDDFGNIPGDNYGPAAAANRINAIFCCRACCDPYWPGD